MSRDHVQDQNKVQYEFKTWVLYAEFMINNVIDFSQIRVLIDLNNEKILKEIQTNLTVCCSDTKKIKTSCEILHTMCLLYLAKIQYGF